MLAWLDLLFANFKISSLDQKHGWIELLRALKPPLTLFSPSPLMNLSVAQLFFDFALEFREVNRIMNMTCCEYEKTSFSRET